MFQFPGFAPIARFPGFTGKGCPIRKSTDHVLFADTRSLSQLITSFFASESLGIPHTPLITSFNDLPFKVLRYWFCIPSAVGFPMCSLVCISNKIKDTHLLTFLLLLLFR